MVTGNIVSPTEKNKILAFVFEEGKNNFFEKYFMPPVNMSLISGGGSDRSFYRIQGRERSVILMVSSSGDADFQNYLAIGRFLREIGIGVPEIYDANPGKFFLFMEDVGDESLYLKFQKGMSRNEIGLWYKKVVEILVHMQVEGGKKWRDCPLARNRTFDYPALRWETEYFQRYFLEEYCGISVPDKEGLAQEFNALAEKVSAEPLYFMHRDFQSKNIMIHQNLVRILDFQGGRRGLLQYDLASIMKDAYVVLPEEIQKRLLTFYLKKLDEKGITIKDQKLFFEIFTLAGLQRNMQTLGAFAYLSLIKGKEWFKQYIPAGINYLYLVLRERSDFPILSTIVKNIASASVD